MVPLIVKFPGQAAGLVSDQNVETVDIVPTIASVLSTTVPYDVDGRSLLDVTQPDRTHKTFIQRSATRVSLEKHGPSLDDRYVGLEQKLLDFESLVRSWAARSRPGRARSRHRRSTAAGRPVQLPAWEECRWSRHWYLRSRLAAGRS